MGFDEGQIILDSDNGAYYTGQTVFGRLVFDQDKSKNIHGICVDFKGFCKVHWTSPRTRRVNDRTETYHVNHDSYEEYFRRKTYVFGDASGEHHLQPGHHEFRFDCPIPVNCPSSFEGSYGHVRYRIKVTMLTTGIFSSNKEKMVAVKVFAPLDLNQNPYCKEPIEYELVSSYCCWCVSAGSSEVQVKLPKGGYCPGQIIPMEVTCKNPSTVEIDEIKFAIKRNIAFTATNESGVRGDHDTVSEIKKGPIPAGTTRNWTVEMEVPVMDIYNMNACQFIDIIYYFKVSTEVGGCHEGSEESRLIVFGNVPLVGFQDNVQNPLHDQMPKITVQNVQGANCYPPPPIINQPLPNSPYPNGNGPYPNASPYPAGDPGYPAPTVGPTPPYPGNQPFPNVSPFPPNPYPASSPSYSANSPYSPSNMPYPTGNSPYPPGNVPYPAGNSPYPAGNSPYTAGNSPYPTNTPYSTDNSPHGGNPSPVPPYPAAGQSPVPPYPAAGQSPVPPYPAAGQSPVPPYPAAGQSPVPPYPAAGQSPVPPYPAAGQSPVPPYPAAGQSPVPPYPATAHSAVPPNPSAMGTTSLKTGTFGFMVPNSGDPASVPLLPPGANVPYPTSPPTNPYATASAPEPSTPGSDQKKAFDGTPEATANSPYNPDFKP